MAQINKPSEYFNTKLYTGNGSTQSITGVGFQPDWIWIKRRDVSEHHCLEDVLRGAGYSVRTSGTDAQQFRSTDITSFDSDGFSLGSNGEVNINSGTFASWNWLAGGTGVSNTDGSITSTVSANTTSGFSIVSYTGTGSAATIGHGLGTVPKVIISKKLNSTSSWMVYHASLGNNKEMYLNATNASSDASATWNSTTPTSSVWSVSTDANNTSGSTYISYVFAEKKGFSKFGSYTGNGNADGTFVYTGFKPAFVICKMTSASGQNWELNDNKRNPYNEAKNTLRPNTADAEDGTFNTCDLLSNGFKLRTSNDATNQSSATYIYMAFAENPLVGTNNIPACAR